MQHIPRKGHLFTIWELKREGRVLRFTSAGKVYNMQLNFFATLHMYILQTMNHYKSSLSTDFGITNKYQQVDELANRRSMNNEDGWLGTDGDTAAGHRHTHTRTLSLSLILITSPFLKSSILYTLFPTLLFHLVIIYLS